MPPAAVIPINARCQGEYVLLQLALPGQPVHEIGVLLLDADPGSPRDALRLRGHWEDLADPEDAGLPRRARGGFPRQDHRGGRAPLPGDRSKILSRTFCASPGGKASRWIPFRAWRTGSSNGTWRKIARRALSARICRSIHCARPLASSAPTKRSKKKIGCAFPRALRLAEGHVRGARGGPLHGAAHPDGSLNIFRAPVVGSRQGKIVLVELVGVHEKYTVKKYTSRKIRPADDEWEHESIRLEPLNPEFEPLDLQPAS